MNEAIVAPLQAPVCPSEDETVVIELVFGAARSSAEVKAEIADAVPGVEVRVNSALAEDGSDRFFFAEFPQLRSLGREPESFDFARALREDLKAEEATPVLVDSISGGAVAAADEESFARFCETPRNEDLPMGWVHPLIGSVSAWQQTRGAGVTVAVIDTGYSDHTELAGSIVKAGQLNLVEGGFDAHDRFSEGFLLQPGHGTLVSSVIASRGDADPQGDTAGPGSITGSAPEASILPIRAIKSVVSFRQTTIPRAIRHAVTQGCGVIAMALGGPTRVSSVEKALREAVASGVVVVCAAGNCWPAVVFPAAYARQGLCCAVAALAADLRPWAKTGRGPAVTVSAPGENVWGAQKREASAPNDTAGASQGTTLATSLVAGIAALWVAHHGGRAALARIAEDAGTTVQAMFTRAVTAGLQKPSVWDDADDLGAGLVDAEKLLGWGLPAAIETTLAKVDTEPVQSTATVFRQHLRDYDPKAEVDFDVGLEPFAAELLWMAYRNGARRKAAESRGLETVAREEERPGQRLAAALRHRSALREFIAGSGLPTQYHG